MSPYKIISADFNNDGLPDLVNTNYYGRTIDLRMNSNGSFPSKVTFTMIEAPLFIVSADFNKDGFMDLAYNVTMANVVDFIQLLYGDGTGHFSDAGKINVEIYQPVVATGDFNGDHYPDLVANTGGDLKFFLNDGKGGFPSLAYSLFEGGQCGSIRCVDINNDGYDDVVTANFNMDKVSVYFTSGNSSPQITSTISTIDFPLDAMPFDFTGDGKLDLVVSHSQGVTVYTGNGLGQFNLLQSFQSPRINELAIADLDGDKKSEILCVSYDVSQVSYLYCHGPGNYSLTSQKFTTGKNPYSLVSADFNNDGRPDVATANLTADNISVFYNNTLKINSVPIICQGTEVLLKATSADSYSWSPSSYTTPAIVVKPAQTTTYSVEGTVGNCKSKATMVVKVDACLSLAEADNDNSFAIFPNPCSAKLSVQAGNASRVTIYNCLGSQVLSQKTTSPQTELNLEDLPEGLYFIQLSSGQKKSFIVNR